MKKLTAEKCKSVIEGFKWMAAEGPGMSIRDEYDIQAYEIALPILEQQERGCTKCNGTGEMDSGGTQPWGEQILIECDCKFERQEQGEGEWLHWNGERALPPVDSLAWVEVKRRNGRLDQRQAQDFAWRNQPVKSGIDIIAYRIIPERATNQNGEQ
ncbi:hypothetical protein [Pantoea sp. 9140]|uniref:hypothetical protein n=1 Tax=Pantoea sp. 9140 TaxID=1500896 RepID=UPI0005356876|nr:hypothetical protein [Pantoea sp. 9140]